MSKTTNTKEVSSKNTITPESVLDLFNDLIGNIDDEIKRIKESPVKIKGCKFLHYIKRRVITLRTQHRRILKQKRKRQNQRNNPNLMQTFMLDDLVVKPKDRNRY